MQEVPRAVLRLTTKCDKDLVYDLLEQHYLSENDFVRSVSFSNGVMSCGYQSTAR